MSTVKEAAPKLYAYRFVILTLVSLMNAFIQFSVLIVPGVAKALITQYGFEPTSFTIIATMPYLTGFVFGILAGAWADKSSIRLVLIVGTAIAFVGALIRPFATTVEFLAIASFLLGFGMAALNATSAKIMRLWFPSKSTSIAMGIYVAAATVGAAIGIGIGPVIPSVELAFQISAGLMAVSLLIWIILARKHPDGETVAAAGGKSESFISHLKVVLKCRNAWLISFCMFFLYGCTISIQTFAVMGYTDLTGSAAGAGALSAFNTILMGVGGILMPIFISRMKSLKPIFVASAVLNACVLIAILRIGFGPWTYIIIAFEGLLYGVLIPLGKTLPALVRDIKLSHIGAAGGMQSTMQNLGAFLVPSFVVAPICTMMAGGDASVLPLLVFAGAGISSIVCGLCVLLIPETGTSVAARLKREAEDAAAAAAVAPAAAPAAAASAAE